MANKEEGLFALLRLGIGINKASDGDYSNLLNLNLTQWRELMNMAETQGVAAIAFDGVQELYKTYQKNITAAKSTPTEWIQWVFECTGMMTQYEQMNAQQKKVIAEVSGLLKENGIGMMVFKGQANASLYPHPAHRAPGDIDCFLFDNAEKGNELLRAQGAQINDRWYRHSKISYKGETIENHRVMGHTRGSKIKQEMENEFRFMANSGGDLDARKVIEGCGEAFMPTAQFNACFLTYHGLHHFLTEGLRMKQVLDWVIFLKVCQNDVDWREYKNFCMKYKLDKFAGVMNYIASDYFGIELSVDIHTEGTYAEKIIQSTLFNDDYLFNSGKNDWAVRWLLVKNMLGRDRWKYEEIAQESVWKHLMGNFNGFVLG